MQRPPLTSQNRAARDALAGAILGAFEDRASARLLDDPGAILVASGAAVDGAIVARVQCARTALAAYHGPRSQLPGALGIASTLLAAGLFFEVHEILEREWQTLTGVRRRFYQGLIQLAVALHHLAAGNPASAVRLFAAARDKLAPLAPTFEAVDVGTLLDESAPWERYAARGEGWPDALALPVLRAAPRV